MALESSEPPDEWEGSGDAPRVEQREVESFNLHPLTPPEIRIDFALCCISFGVPTRTVKRELMRLCRVGERSAESVVKDALAELVGGFTPPRRALRCMSAAWYQMQLIDPDCPRDLKFKARQALDVLLGLRDPVKSETDDDGDDAKREAKAEKDEIRRALDQMPLEELKALHRAQSAINRVVKGRGGEGETVAGATIPTKEPQDKSIKTNAPVPKPDTVSVATGAPPGEMF